MSSDSVPGDLRAVLQAAGERLGFAVTGASLLRRHSNAIFALPSQGIVVRIATNPAALSRVAASIAVTRWLAERGFPCVVPADIQDQPVVVEGHVVSVWRYLPTTQTPPPTGTDIGLLLRTLHALPDPPHPIRNLDDPFSSVSRALQEAPGAMPEASRSWLTDRIASLRDRWSAMTFPLAAGLIHGDAHLGNLMRAGTGQILLGDWDHVAAGPREWDLIQIHYLHRRFSRVGNDDIEAFTAAYGWDIRTWPELNALIAIREITGLSPYIRSAQSSAFSRQQLTFRIHTLRANDERARWQSPPAQ